MNVDPIIVVPVYKEFTCLDETELTSLKCVIKVLGKHPIELIGPNGINLESYREVFSINQTPFTCRHFKKEYFVSVQQYSRLLLSAFFYETYAAYSHILIYQLDAFVFEDQLEYWCSLGYDYIGAPWVAINNGSLNFTGVGNGGFSLRKTSSFIKVLKSAKGFKRYNEIKKEYWRYPSIAQLIRVPIFFLRALTGWRNTGKHYARLFSENEDLFWGLDVVNSRYAFKTPPTAEAIKFSFEVAPQILYKMNNHNLPFGCHAWLKYDAAFWKKFITW